MGCLKFEIPYWHIIWVTNHWPVFDLYICGPLHHTTWPPRPVASLWVSYSWVPQPLVLWDRSPETASHKSSVSSHQHCKDRYNNISTNIFLKVFYYLHYCSRLSDLMQKYTFELNLFSSTDEIFKKLYINKKKLRRYFYIILKNTTQLFQWILS